VSNATAPWTDHVGPGDHDKSDHSVRVGVETRALPHDLAAEASFLGTVLAYGDRYPTVADLLAPDDFYRHAHAVVWRAMGDLYREQRPIDFVTLREYLSRSSDIDVVGGPAYLASLVDGRMRSTNLDAYAEIVREKSTLRRLIATSGETIDRAYEHDAAARDIVAETQQRLFALTAKQIGDFTKMRDLASQGMASLETLFQQAKTSRDGVTGIPSGFRDLDRMTAGWQAGDLIIIGARPSVGKTAFALNVAEHAGLRGRGVAVFELEMTKDQLFRRMLAAVARVSGEHLRNGFLSEAEWGRLSQAIGTLSEAAIHIDDRSGLTVVDIEAKCLRLAATEPLDLVVIDYLQLMRPASTRRNGTREQEIGEISQSLKELAKQLRIPIIVLSQLSRAVESRSDHRPQLSDLRESGRLEQDADVVIFIHRPEMYGDADISGQMAGGGDTELIVAKQRNGPTGDVSLSYLKPFTRFENVMPVDAPRHVT
jgi:replicative DNA helicase